MWRPEGYTNPFAKEYDGTLHLIYESAYDACLEALKKEGDYLTKGDYFTERQVSSNGYLVFIPD